MKVHKIIISIAIYCSAWGIFFYTGGSSFAFYYDPLAILFILLPTICFSLVNYSPKDITGYFKLINKNNNATEKTYKQAILFFLMLKEYIVKSATISIFIGIVHILSDFEDAKQFGRWLAVVLLSVIYATMLIMFLVSPCHIAIKKKLNSL